MPPAAEVQGIRLPRKVGHRPLAGQQRADSDRVGGKECGHAAAEHTKPAAVRRACRGGHRHGTQMRGQLRHGERMKQRDIDGWRRGPGRDPGLQRRPFSRRQLRLVVRRHMVYVSTENTLDHD